MSELQQLFAQWISGFANLIPLGYAFGAGMVSAVNPCGFAMLPAYLGLYLGSLEPAPGSSVGALSAARRTTLAAQVWRAILISLLVTAGFVLFFGGMGLLISAGGRFIVRVVPWVALVIGFILVFLGLAMLAGRHLSANFAARLAARLDPSTAGIRGFFVFGVAYAAASLSCTLPVFLTVVGGSLVGRGFASGALQFVSYALGMGVIILILSLGIGVFKGAMVGWLRKALPYVERVSALLLILAGSYIVYYWLFKGGLIDTFR